MRVGAAAQLWVVWQGDRKVEGSLRNGSEQSHTSLAGEPAAPPVQGQAPGTSDTVGGCGSWFLLCQLLQGYDLGDGKWKPREAKALALQNTACKSQEHNY